MELNDDLFGNSEHDEEVVNDNVEVDSYLTHKYGIQNTDTDDESDDDADDESDDEPENHDNNTDKNNGDGNNEGNKPKNNEPNNDESDDEPAGDTVYSIISEELSKAGVLKHIDGVSTVEDLTKAIDKEVDERLKEKLLLAENNNLTPELQEYKENSDIISRLNEIKSKNISGNIEDKYDKLKENIVSQYLKVSGTPEKLQNRILEGLRGNKEEMATECADAVDYLIKHYSDANSEMLESINKKKAEKEQAASKFQNDVMTSLSDEKDKFSMFNVNKREREKAIRILSEKSFKDSNGNSINAIEKYKQDNPVEFEKNITLFYTITNGFTDFKQLSKIASRVGVKNTEKRLSELLSKGTTTTGTKNGKTSNWLFDE